MVESQIVILVVAGSSPVGHPTLQRRLVVHTVDSGDMKRVFLQSRRIPPL